MAKQTHVLTIFAIGIGLLLGGCAHSGIQKDKAFRNEPKPLSTQQKLQLQAMSHYIYPGLSLGDANKLIGWKAGFRGGNWYWSPDGGLLVQTTLSRSNIEEDPLIVAVYDYYRDVSMQYDRNNGLIKVSRCPRPE